MEQKHPIQPLALDINGTMRFKGNVIVQYLLEEGPFDMNQLAVMSFDKADREQFAQLIGYSFSGFGELSYVSDDTYNAAESMSEGKDEKDAQIERLQKTLDDVRAGMVHVIPHLFRIHPDDLLTA